MGVHRTCGEPDEIELAAIGGEIERLPTPTRAGGAQACPLGPDDVDNLAFADD